MLNSRCHVCFVLGRQWNQISTRLLMEWYRIFIVFINHSRRIKSNVDTYSHPTGNTTSFDDIK